MLPWWPACRLLAPDLIVGLAKLARRAAEIRERVPRSFVAEAVERSGPAVVSLETARTVARPVFGCAAGNDE